MSAKRIVLMTGAIAGLVLAAAWFQGGEQPLRPISQPVAVPGAAR